MSKTDISQLHNLIYILDNCIQKKGTRDYSPELYKSSKDTIKNAINNLGGDINTRDDHGDINTRDHHGNTALLHALLIKESEIANLLINKGADVNLCNNNPNLTLYKLSPLIMASSLGDTKTVKNLIEHNVDITYKDFTYEAFPDEDIKEEDIKDGTAIYTARTHKHEGIVRLLVGAIKLNQESTAGQSAEAQEASANMPFYSMDTANNIEISSLLGGTAPRHPNPGTLPGCDDL